MTFQPAATALTEALKGGLVVSCQPVPGGPFDDSGSVVRFALAAQDAGARGLRIEGVANVAAVAAACSIPIIGLVKRDLAETPVRITPWIEDVVALAESGAAIIAFDATDRPRPVAVGTLIEKIHSLGCLAMADIATIAEARNASALGADLIGTTMSGYTDVAPPPRTPDIRLVWEACGLGKPVLAEGRYNEPRLAAAAIRAGAAAVVVGSAITRPEHITRWFIDAIAVEAAPARPVLAIDIGGSKTAVALVLKDRILERRQVPTLPADGAEAWLQAAADVARDWRGQYDGVAAAVTGLIRNGLWTAVNPATLPVPADFPLVSCLAEQFGDPALALNDAQAAAWGEYRFGAGRGRDLLFLTVSSGIGGGAVVGGQLLSGSGGLAGHVGQIPVPVPGKRHHRLEDLASGFAISAAARAEGHDADAKTVFAAMAAGESWAEGIVGEAVDHLALTLPGLQALLDPQIMVIGGGVGLAAGFLPRLEAALSRFPSALKPSLAPALLGADAGLLGAADLLRRRMSLETDTTPAAGAPAPNA
ncbi:putative N-acetylmannosamine-6-phosphate 2-epimerase [Microvirga mediterraneensis]|uniref:Putative N-acetylmannosamine-6-phosphate 2-epimerase n=1 Tax=Microvirga mediterraneensis TaxID=2754695 RepID=A0A838BTK6_9HYPH|nr:putative N-acetylmannosamine-6-phosphate 2-epimerase [Microvirga mediterraneensis]MBA1158761.1 putative N-acetylmannosamine-6-phosphate 2-epimerase [Microvirga mediterraneensis]